MAAVMGGEDRETGAERHADEPAERRRKSGHRGFDARQVEAVGAKGKAAQFSADPPILGDGLRRVGMGRRNVGLRRLELTLDGEIHAGDELSAQESILEGALAGTAASPSAMDRVPKRSEVP